MEMFIIYTGGTENSSTADVVSVMGTQTLG